MKRYMLMEDNEDGTISITLSIDGNEEMKALAAFDFNDIVRGIVPDEIKEAVEKNADRFTIIPNDMESL